MFTLLKNHRIFVSGHNGMVGSAIVRRLRDEGYANLLVKTRTELDLIDQDATNLFFKVEKPDIVILAAAKVGGIQANIDAPADFLYDNLMIATNILHACYQNAVKKTVVLGSSCIYPRECLQPMKEEYLLTGPLEPTNEGYALAKIAAVKMAQYYHQQYGLCAISPIPCNLYGPNDSFDPRRSHVLSALVRKFSDGVSQKQEEVVMWGTGSARRELMHVDDVAAATLFLLEKYNEPEIINVGWGKDYSIKELADMVAKKVGYNGRVRWDSTKPDGMPRKCMDTSRITALGFQPTIDIAQGIDGLIHDYERLQSNHTA